MRSPTMFLHPTRAGHHPRRAAWPEWVKRVWSWLADAGAGRARARMARGQYHF